LLILVTCRNVDESITVAYAASCGFLLEVSSKIPCTSASIVGDDPMKVRWWKFFSSFLLVVGCFSELQADTIDQSSGLSSATITSFSPIGQSFLWTTDRGLGSIAFDFVNNNPTFGNGPVTMTLYVGIGFTGNVLGSVTQLLPTDLPGPGRPGLFVDFSFSGIVLTPGITYTAAVTATSARHGVVYQNLSDAYSGGSLYLGRGTLGTCVSGGTCDLNFRVTPDVSVPELPSAALLVWGVGGLSILVWNRRTERLNAKGLRPLDD